MAARSSSSSSSSPQPFQSVEVEKFWRQLMDACRRCVAGRDMEYAASSVVCSVYHQWLRMPC